MKLHQLRYLAAIVDNGLNITAAARALHTSQPGVSKQVKLLEDELGFELFERQGRTLKRLTRPASRW
jgi:LysR family transcriptional regulator, cys regulon transcriptional activator